MNITEIAPYAAQYGTLLRTLRESICVEHIISNAPFIKVYQEVIPALAGAYIIHLPDDIIYIGKALNFRERIWHHLNAAVREEPEDSFFFSGSRFLLDEDIDAAVRSEIRKGNFQIDYFSINEPGLADGLEVFLQSVYYAKERRLPKGNKQFG